TRVRMWLSNTRSVGTCPVQRTETRPRTEMRKERRKAMPRGHSSAGYPYRVRLLVLRMLVLSVAVCAVFVLISGANAESETPAAQEHVVASGESLSGIAESAAPAAADRRGGVRGRSALSALSAATSRPGEVPTQPPELYVRGPASRSPP